MKFEHLALNVPDSASMADWYVRNCEMKILRAQEKSPFGYFLADWSGRVTLELYSNPGAPIPDYQEQHHLSFHVAFSVEDALAEKDRLLAAGATWVETLEPEAGSVIVMMRDPWNVPLQLCQRETPID